VDRVLSHDEIRELLGAYALDAVEPDEAEALAAHLTGCPRCAAEVEGHRQVAGLIANAGGDAPEEIWPRIAAAIGASGEAPAIPPAPLLAVPTTGSAPAPGLARRRPRAARTVIGALAAAAVALGVVLAVQVHRLDARVGQVAAAAQRHGLDEAVQAALLDPAAHTVRLSAAGGTRRLAELVVLPDGSAFALNTGMPPLGAGRTYQLWGFVHGTPVSLAVLGGDPAQVPFRVSPGVTVRTFAVTDEVAGGAPRPTHAPVAQSTATT